MDLVHEPEVNVVLLAKGRERYIFVFDDAHRMELADLLYRWATRPDLSFNFYDAARISKNVRTL